MNDLIYKQAFTPTVHTDNGDRTISAIMTREVVDEDGEVLIVAGCDTGYSDTLKGMGVILYHDDKKPVGKVRRVDKRTNLPVPEIMLSIMLSSIDAAKDVLTLVREGILHISHGFTRLNSRAPTQQELAKWPGVKIVTTAWRPHEVTLTPIPCLPEAQVVSAAKSLLDRGQIHYSTYSKLVRPRPIGFGDASEKRIGFPDLTRAIGFGGV